jgi:hypothetical protein
MISGEPSLTTGSVLEYIPDLKTLVLSKLSSQIDELQQRRNFVMVDSGLPLIWDNIITNGSNKEFVDTLIDHAAEMDLPSSGPHPLLAILQAVTAKVNSGELKEITEMKIKIINSQKNLEQAYVALLLDSDFSNYIPIDDADLRRHNLIVDTNRRLTFKAIQDRINEIGKNRYYERKRYQNFTIDPWLYCNCEELREWYRVLNHFNEDRFLAILVDNSIFNSPCSSTVRNIMNFAVEKEGNPIGIACIMNCGVPSPTTPSDIEKYNIIETYLRTIDEIANFLWDKYHRWRINRELGGILVSRAGA